jgi:HemY protein
MEERELVTAVSLGALLFVAIVAALTLGAGYLTDSTEGIRVAALGYEFTLGPLQAVIVALVLLAVVWLVVRLVGLLVAILRFLNAAFFTA